MLRKESRNVVSAATERAGKYLTFGLAKEEYGLEILKVREIIGMMDVTPVPLTPEYFRGVINLRGKVIPVVDLRSKFGMTRGEQTAQTCIIVVDVGGIEMGIVVDRVSEVLDIVAEDIDDAPSFGAEVDTTYIKGVARLNGRVTILLDIDGILSNDEIEAITGKAN